MFSSAKKSKKQKGQGLVEYALILVLVAIVVIAALMILGPLIGNVFSTINSSLSSFGSGVPGGGGGGDACNPNPCRSISKDGLTYGVCRPDQYGGASCSYP